MKKTDTSFRRALTALSWVLLFSGSLLALRTIRPVTTMVSTVGGAAFYDCNGNGTREGEPSFANISVALAGTATAGGSVQRTTTTDANGNYQFINLEAGNYTVTFDFPSGATALAFSPKTVGGSQANSNGATDPLSIDGISNVNNINVGIIDSRAPKISWVHPLLSGLLSSDTLIVECDNLPQLDASAARALDNTGVETTVYFEDLSRTSGNCSRDGYLELLICRWSSHDTCGNSDQIELFIKVVDTKKPTLVNVPTNLTVNTTTGGVVPSVPIVTGADVCSGSNLATNINQTQTANNCGYLLTRTWTTTDNCGNTASASQQITVITVPNCNPPRLSMDTIALSFIGSGVIDTCLNLGIGRTITNIRHCGGRPLATLSSQGGSCIRIEPIPNAAGVDTICAQTCDASGQNCRDLMLVLSFSALRLPPCGILPGDRNVALTAPNCTANACYCLANTVDIRILSTEYTITDNGRPYGGGFAGCRFDTLYSYSYFSAPNMGTRGPYRLDFWQLNGSSRTIASFQTMQQLVDSMRVWDPIGNWQIDSISLSIYGGSSRNSYGGIKITKLSNGAIGLLELNTSLISNGVEMCFNRGNHTVLFRNNTSGCIDTFNVTVFCPSDSRVPNAIDDRVSTVKNQSVDIVVLANDSINGVLQSVNTIRQPTRGTVVRNAQNVYTYTPNRDSCGIDDTFTYSICNNFGFCDTATVTVSVSCDTTGGGGNIRKPLVINDIANTVKGRAVTINALSNDSTFGNLTRPLSIVRNPSRGSVAVVSNQIIYTPDTSFCGGNDTLAYEICNANGCDTADVVVTVSCDTTGGGGGNRRPVAVDDRVTTLLNTAVTVIVLGNDSINGSLIRPINIIRYQSRGSSTIVNNQIVYTPLFGVCNFDDTLSYEICNANGCDTADVFIAVNCDTTGGGGGNNRKPIAVNDATSTVKGRAVTVNVLANDITNGNLTRPLSIIRSPSRAAASVLNNQIVYIPDTSFCGGNDTLAYEICNANGCDTADVVITVACDTSGGGGGRRPVAIDDRATTVLNTAVTINVLANDSINGTLIRPLSILRFQSRGSSSVLSNQIVYTPIAGQCGFNDTLTYEICNTNGCDTAEVIVTVSCDTSGGGGGNNRKPLAINDVANTVKGRAVTINALSNDSTFGTLIRPLSIVRTPRRGSVAVVSNQIVYTPDTSFCGGNDTLAYEICNANGCDTADVVSTVSCDTSGGGGNLKPVAIDDIVTVPISTPTPISVLANDQINGTLVGGVRILRFQSRGGANLINNQIVYTGATCGARDTMTYEICNANGCDTADVIITTICDTSGGGGNRKPLAVNDVANTVKGRAVTINALSNDSTFGNLTRPLSIVRNSNRGTAVVVSNQIVYTPDTSFCDGNDTLAYEICNANGCDTADVVITVSCDTSGGGGNLKPVAIDDIVTVPISTPTPISVLANDQINGTLVGGVRILRFQSRGGANLINNQIVYTGATCGARDTMTYEICNANGCDTADVIITTSCDTSGGGSNRKPLAVNDVANTVKGRAVTITALSNDSTFGTLTRPLSIVRNPSRGSVAVVSNQIVYTPDTSFCGGNDTLAYEICNANGCDTADVVITISCDTSGGGGGSSNRLIVAVDDRITVQRNGAITFRPLNNDTIRLRFLALGVVRTARNGNIGFVGTDSLIYEPNVGFCGRDTFEYRICDTAFNCDTAFVFVNVNCDSIVINLKPVAVNDTTSTLVNRAVTISVLANDTIFGALVGTVKVIRNPRFGTPTVNNNQIVYTPFAGFCGANDTLSYEICNVNGCDTAEVIVRVICDSTVRNRLPVAVFDTALTRKNTAVRILVLRNDTINGTLDSFRIIRSPLFGTAILSSDNVITYTPDSCGFTDSLIYRICNPNGCDTAVVRINVTCDSVSSRRIIAVDDSTTTRKNQPLSINVVQNDSLFGQRLDTIYITRTPRRGVATVRNNQIVYTPQRDSCGYRDTLSYAICTVSGCDTADVVINVICQNDTLPPIANFDTASGTRRSPLSIAVLLNDSVRGADTFRITRNPRNGIARFDSTSLNIVYTPDTTKCGRDSLIYEICNRRGCDTAIVYINIACDSQSLLPPVALNDTAITLINEKAAIAIFVNDTLRGARLVEVVTPASRGIVLVMPDSTAMYTPDREFCGRDSFQYRICNTAGCDTAWVSIIISCGDSVRVFTGFSPNNDGRNDRFVIRGIENYPDNEVIVYNRWGNEVFRKKAYRNDSGFDGTWNGQNLPDGTYFFCINLNDGVTTKPIIGYVQIMR